MRHADLADASRSDSQTWSDEPLDAALSELVASAAVTLNRALGKESR